TLSLTSPPAALAADETAIWALLEGEATRIAAGADGGAISVTRFDAGFALERLLTLHGNDADEIGAWSANRAVIFPADGGVEKLGELDAGISAMVEVNTDPFSGWPDVLL